MKNFLALTRRELGVYFVSPMAYIILTAPISDATFVLAKFAAAMVLLCYLLILTLGYLFIVSQYAPVDVGAAFCGYLGVFVLGAVMYSIGLFISALCAHQITAGVITLMMAALLVIANLIALKFPEGSAMRSLLATIDLSSNFGDFVRGVIDRARVVYLLSVVVFFLYLTTRVVESRRWR